MKTICALIVALLFLTPALARSSEQPIVVAFDHDSPPFSYLEDSKAVGIYPGIVKELFKRIGQPVDLRAYPWKRVIAGIDNAQSAAGGIYVTAERLKKYTYSTAIFSDPVLIFKRKDSPVEIHMIENLRGLNLGVITGWSYGDRFDQLRNSGFITVEEVRNDATNLRKLQANRLDGYLAVEISGRSLLAQKELTDQIIAIPRPITVNNVYLAFNQKDPNRALLSQLNRAFDQISKNGRLKEILDAHISPDFRHLILAPEQLQSTLI